MLGVTMDFGHSPSLAEGIGYAHVSHEPMFDLPSLLVSHASDEVVGGTGAAGVDAAMFQRRHQMGKTGVILFIVGIPVVLVGAVVLVGSTASGSGSGMLAGYGIMVGGNALSITGEVMLFVGGIGASNLLSVDNAIGWVGVGLAVGANVAAFIPGVSVLSTPLAIGGLVCGAVQLGKAGRAGRDAGLLTDVHLVPTGNGMLVAGRF